MPSKRTLALGSLALGTSVWLGCALTGASVPSECGAIFLSLLSHDQNFRG